MPGRQQLLHMLSCTHAATRNGFRAVPASRNKADCDSHKCPSYTRNAPVEVNNSTECSSEFFQTSGIWTTLIVGSVTLGRLKELRAVSTEGGVRCLNLMTSEGAK